MSRDFVEIFVTIDGAQRIDFDKKKVRKVLRKEGRKIQDEARYLVSGLAGSEPGKYPGVVSGTLFRSIREKVSRPGFLVSIAPRMIEGMKSFYPAYLHYGVKRGAVRRKDHRKQTLESQWRVAPRGNYMVDALRRREAQARAAIAKGLQEALISK